jgi:hypothetical protein
MIGVYLTVTWVGVLDLVFCGAGYKARPDPNVFDPNVFVCRPVGSSFHHIIFRKSTDFNCKTGLCLRGIRI